MKLSMHSIAAAVALAFAFSAQAAQESRTDTRDAQQRINQEHRAAMDRCKGMSGNAEDVCKAEADGKKKVAEAELKLQRDNTAENRRNVAETKAKAQYEVEKQRCDDLKGDAKNACQNQAQANRDRAMASARGQTQDRPSSPGAGSSPGASKSSPPPSSTR
jgi:hypothetical protein